MEITWPLVALVAVVGITVVMIVAVWKAPSNTTHENPPTQARVRDMGSLENQEKWENFSQEYWKRIAREAQQIQKQKEPRYGQKEQ